MGGNPFMRGYNDNIGLDDMTKKLEKREESVTTRQ
jgi:hypothetical protein